MRSRASIALALVGALAVVGCGGGKDTPLTCAEIRSCVSDTCVVDGNLDETCRSNCIAKGSPDAQAKYNALQSCTYAASASNECVHHCIGTTPQACTDCVVEQCAAEYAACQ